MHPLKKKGARHNQAKNDHQRHHEPIGVHGISGPQGAQYPTKWPVRRRIRCIGHGVEFRLGHEGNGHYERAKCPSAHVGQCYGNWSRNERSDDPLGSFRHGADEDRSIRVKILPMWMELRLLPIIVLSIIVLPIIVLFGLVPSEVDLLVAGVELRLVVRRMRVGRLGIGAHRGFLQLFVA